MRAPFAMALALLAGCRPEFDNGHVLDELRILAVRAEPPELRVGERAELQALVFAPGGAIATTHMWQCAARGGMRQGCETFDDSIDLGEGTTAEIEIGPDWEEYLDAVGLPVHQVVTVVATTPSEVERAIKRVVVSEEEVANRNPTLEALLLGDEEEEEPDPHPASTSQSIRVTPVVSADSVETYDKLNLAGERVSTEEELFLSYYFTCGSATSLKSGGPDDLAATYRAPSEPSSCTLVAVLRDDRGGEDWRSREIVVPEE
ncbi:MAG: hypothetical protein HYY06_15600 [Deltaproteobacteria bacterium]|nr:hypothetical protein [Deltaproteobacteria bacterium]